jgi:uncharacterized membrane protein YdjX (TVP38/TMEM64 family)
LLVGLALAALVAALIIWWRPIYGFLSDQEQVRTWVEQLGAWGPVAIVLLEMTQALLAPIPGQAIEAVSGYLYGPWLGTLYPMIGMVIGSSIIFSLSRRFGRPLVIRLIGKQSMARMDDLVHRGGALFFFLIWLLPFAPDDLACVAAGLTPMPFRQFLVLMTLGRLPGVFVSVLVGANVSRIQPVWWVVLFVGIALAAVVFWRWGEQIQEAVLGYIERLSNRSNP